MENDTLVGFEVVVLGVVGDGSGCGADEADE